jgi:hypothetical protein
MSRRTTGIGEQELLQRISALPREIPPGRDPWPDIAARIAAPSALRARLPRWGMLAAAASLLLAVAAGWLLAPRWSGVGQPAEVSLQLSASAANPRAVSGLPGSVAASEAEYQAAFREFIPVGVTRANIAPQTVTLIESGWAELRDAERRLAAALEANPNDAFLNGRMLELRARQLGFLRRLATIDLENRRLTI